MPEVLDLKLILGKNFRWFTATGLGVNDLLNLL